MEFLRLVSQDAYSISDMYQLGYSNEQITQYCDDRRERWRLAAGMMKQKFFMYGPIFVTKDHDETKQCMRVAVYNYNNLLLCEYYHQDPLLAVSQCAFLLENAETYILGMLNNIRI